MAESDNQKYQKTFEKRLQSLAVTYQQAQANLIVLERLCEALEVIVSTDASDRCWKEVEAYKVDEDKLEAQILLLKLEASAYLKPVSHTQDHLLFNEEKDQTTERIQRKPSPLLILG